MTRPSFTLDTIEKAHDGAETATVPDYLRSLRRIGVVRTITHISDGHTDYEDSAGRRVSTGPVHETYSVAEDADPDTVPRALKAHEQGQMDYFSMCRALAAAGVATWIMDTGEMTFACCSSAGQEMYRERL